MKEAKMKKPVSHMKQAVAGAAGIEPATNGFGDRYSTN